jgi:glycosyltransferase involved in cell wall biosynthesis
LSSGTVIVNNSRETYTTSHSGAIATCILEVVRVAGEGAPTVISRKGPGSPITGYPLVYVPSKSGPHGRIREQIRRARRRVDGWARPDQREYAHDVRAALRALDARQIIVNNDPEVAVALAHAFPSAHVVHWFHNLELAGDRFRRRFAASNIRSVAVSRYLARAVEAAYGLTPLSVSHVLNGASFSEAVPLPTGDLTTIGFVGRVAVEKGVDVLLAACLELAESRRDFRVQLVGDTNWGRSDGGPYSRLIDAQTEELKHAGIEVVRLGHLPRKSVPGAIAATDIHVVPSRWDEPFGLTTLEGLALGRAVVVSATGGSPELVMDAGVLFPREDPSALARVLSALLDDPQRRADLASRARERANELSWQQTWETLRGGP